MTSITRPCRALDTLAEEYEIFEETMKKVTLETEEGDMLYAVASEVGKSSTGLRKAKTVHKTSWSSRVRERSPPPRSSTLS